VSMIECEYLYDGRCELTGGFMSEDNCRFCTNDKTGIFRAKLKAHKAKMDLKKRKEEGTETYECPGLVLEVDALFCEECLRNPYLRQRMAQSRIRRVRLLPCKHRGEEVGTREVTCCGGKVKEFPTVACDLRDEPPIVVRDCVKCNDFEPVEELDQDEDWCRFRSSSREGDNRLVRR